MRLSEPPAVARGPILGDLKKEKIMKRLSLTLIGVVVFTALLSLAEPVGAQRRKVVVHPKKVVVRRPVVHTKLVVRPNHPVRRVLPQAVVVRPARKTLVMGAPLVYLSSV